MSDNKTRHAELCRQAFGAILDAVAVVGIQRQARMALARCLINDSGEQAQTSDERAIGDHLWHMLQAIEPK